MSRYVCSQNAISTHTLTWSVTKVLTVRYEDIIISTHTLTWSVTGRYSNGKSRTWDFNSHAHVERDGRWWLSQASVVISTHTLTWSVTQPDVRIDKAYDISTHTLTWSVT